MSSIIGIDLGTTTSEICVYEEGKPKAIKNRRENPPSEITPSIVGLDPKNNQIVVGKRPEGFYENIVRKIKRKMGKDENIKLGNNNYKPEDISAIIIRHLKDYAERELNEDVIEAVITAPANFPIEARKATEIAADLAGIKVLRIINEPTAAALAYGINQMQEGEKVLVFDLGGGTFDII